MHISIFGMGYVGAVCAACWARENHTVTGVDVNADKVAVINRGESPIIEPGLPETIAQAVERGRLRAVTEARNAVLESDISMVCVGTPSQLNGNLDLRFVRNVCEQIGEALRQKADYHVVVLRSTMLPGTARKILTPVLELASGKQAGRDFGVAVNPEFLREGSAISDFYQPSKTVVGSADERSGDIVASLYEALALPVTRLDTDSAEMIKYASNAWHAAKVVFANEIGNLCKALGVDGQKVMEVFCQDTKLNLSSSYLRPGFAFGGSCLPKDVRAICYKAKNLDLKSPMLESLLASNQHQIERALTMIQSQPGKKVGLLGLSFKPGTDDLRESPLVELAERLLGKGYDVSIYDRNVSLARLGGANKDYLLNRLPHISGLLTADLSAAVDGCDVLVIGSDNEEFSALLENLDASQRVVDLVRISPQTSAQNYEGICW